MKTLEIRFNDAMFGLVDPEIRGLIIPKLLKVLEEETFKWSTPDMKLGTIAADVTKSKEDKEVREHCQDCVCKNL